MASGGVTRFNTYTKAPSAPFVVLLENVLKQVAIVGMAESNVPPNDWKLLTLVGVADRLVARTSLEKDPEESNARKNRWSASKKIIAYILRKLSSPGNQAAAIKGLRDLDEAREKALCKFNDRMPDGRPDSKAKSADSTPLTFEPASPEIILKAFCYVALRVRSTATEAQLADIVWHTFRHVVAPQLAAHLFLLERTFASKEAWPKDYSAKGSADAKEAWSKPSALLRGVVDGTFDRRQLQANGPLLSISEFKAKALSAESKCDQNCAKAALLLRILLQQCADTEAEWHRAQSMAGIVLRFFDAQDQQVNQGLGSAERVDLSAATMAEFSDLTSAAVNADLNQKCNHLDRKLNLPQTRRRILSFTPFITDPSSAELDSDFDSAVRMLRLRIDKNEGDEWARACMGYAYYMSRRCLVSTDKRTGTGSDDIAGQAASLTYDLMVRAFNVGAPATQQIALRYLTGFCTNPRFRCSALAQKNSEEWVKAYRKSSPKGMANLFKARLAYIKNDRATALKLYRDMFLRALPAGFNDPLKRSATPLEDHEALAYLLPECYTLAGVLLSEKTPDVGAESELQKQIRRAGVAHFGIECNWQLEAQRIMAGFAYRKELLA